MKHIQKFILVPILFTVLGCDRELESEGITAGIIRYPSITLNEGLSQALVQGQDTYEELGAVALLGTDDISDKLVIEGADAIDYSSPGVYPVNYSVTITTELGEESTVSATRYVLVTTEDVSDVDLSGNYIGTGFSSNPRVMPVTKIGDGLYSIPDVLSSANGIAATFAHLGGDVLVIPNQPSLFGDINTTSDGAGAQLTETGFKWSVFIGCCGVFGPIDFVKQ